MKKPRIKKEGVEKMKNPQIRFKGGSLLMLSRKTTVSGKIPYYFFKGNEVVSYQDDESDDMAIIPLEESWQGSLDRGIPILVFETPTLVKRDFSPKYKERFIHYRSQKKVGKFWQVKFVFNERLCVMFLTEKQYNHELVKAVPARMVKDYSKNKKS